MLASENSYVRPVFNDQKIMDIKEGRHGVIEKVMGHGKYVPNDVSIDENSPVVLITGPNMGGKSTYVTSSFNCYYGTNWFICSC